MDDQQLTRTAETIYDSLKNSAIGYLGDCHAPIRKISQLFDDPNYKSQAVKAIKEELESIYRAGELDLTHTSKTK